MRESFRSISSLCHVCGCPGRISIFVFVRVVCMTFVAIIKDAVVGKITSRRLCRISTHIISRPTRVQPISFLFHKLIKPSLSCEVTEHERSYFLVLLFSRSLSPFQIICAIKWLVFNLVCETFCTTMQSLEIVSPLASSPIEAVLLRLRQWSLHVRTTRHLVPQKSR